MKIKLSLILLCSLTSCTFAAIEIIPFAQFDLPDSIKTQEIKKNIQSKKLGYIQMANNFNYPKELINTRHTDNKSLITKKYLNDPQDTHLKKNIENVKLVFNFKTPNFISPNEIIGYAPAGTYVNGWTGIKMFFETKDVGVCSYEVVTINNIQLNKDLVTYSVNDKPTITNIEGNKKDGFLYKAGWYKENTDETVISNELECANMKFEKEIMNKMVILANKIDKQ